jgi:hypothetical protein
MLHVCILIVNMHSYRTHSYSQSFHCRFKIAREIRLNNAFDARMRAKEEDEARARVGGGRSQSVAATASSSQTTAAMCREYFKAEKFAIGQCSPRSARHDKPKTMTTEQNASLFKSYVELCSFDILRTPSQLNSFLTSFFGVGADMLSFVEFFIVVESTSCESVK